MPDFYPMIFEPIYKNYVWGGHNLKKFGRVLTDVKKVAESWEIAAHKDGLTFVANGSFAGKSLQELLDDFGVCFVGTKNRWALDRGKFPFLIKLIDANQALSVQVHPDDSYARENEYNELGKAEMWVILWAKPGAEIIYGLSDKMTPDALRGAIETGNLVKYLNRVPIKTGDHVCVPAGTLHAILEGIVLIEIQQNSNTTYRVYDWDRVGKDGQPRQLHIEKALDVINYEQVGLSLQQAETMASDALWRSERLCQNPYFSLERHFLQKGGSFVGDCDGLSLEIWGLISGEVSINGLDIDGVKFVLLPAALGPFEINAMADSILLRSFAT